jgi:MerR family mercuric resistance operon transcriptional regulator
VACVSFSTLVIASSNVTTASGDPQSCGEARALAAEKLALVESRVADLQRLRGVLQELIGRCDRRRGKIACPIIESLARQG